jgi:hypothetical protein
MLTLKRRVDGILASLSSLGVKTYPPEDKGECVEAIVDYEGESYFIYAYEGRYSDTLIIKITPTPRDCATALLDPDGLFALGGQEGVLAMKIKQKLERLNKIVKHLKSS